MPSDCEQSEWIIVQELKGEGKLRGRRSVKVRARIDRGGSFSLGYPLLITGRTREGMPPERSCLTHQIPKLGSTLLGKLTMKPTGRTMG